MERANTMKAARNRCFPDAWKDCPRDDAFKPLLDILTPLLHLQPNKRPSACTVAESCENLTASAEVNTLSL